MPDPLHSHGPDYKATEELIRELVSNFIDLPEMLVIRYQPSEDGESIYWMMKGAPTDEAKLVGSGGCHVKALTFLIEQFGESWRKSYTFRLLTEKKTDARPHADRKDVITYDPTNATNLLMAIMRFLSISISHLKVGAGSGERTALKFEFVLTPQDSSDLEALTQPRGETQETILNAISTLFRAIAKQAGVRFVVTVEGAQ